MVKRTIRLPEDLNEELNKRKDETNETVNLQIIKAVRESLKK